ncbi:hypothetical protein Dda_3945 [Drechslerella dactyloides]|uniref:Chromatin structure-remodeling complex subunit rsc9 n=1 Tax=Drechslerella dactyloides TaxID=74499 RepID=A0AAD6IZA7_DREDA|nr:hypothetical protein Dda_3945 [Drechslerella dactyloides]
MGPKNQYTAHPREFDESDIDRTPEYEDFIKTISALHERRGPRPRYLPLAAVLASSVALPPAGAPANSSALSAWRYNSVTALTNLEPDIQRKKVDLRKLYKTVTDLGGYTAVSGKIGLWKELAVEFNPPQHNTNIGFVLKTIYWKNLAAYECEHHWKVEAPRPEAVEMQTAAGTDLVGRKAPETVEASSPALLTRGRSGTGETSTSGAAQPSSGRTLREAPPKRQFFQPDVSTPKPRSTGAMNQSPAPQATVNGKGTPNAMHGSSGALHSNNPPLPPLRVIAVPTPYSKPQAFAQKAAHRNANRPTLQNLPPGYPADGPSPLWRAIMGIASRIPSEVEYGLTNLLHRTTYAGHGVSLLDYPELGDDLVAILKDCVSAVIAQTRDQALNPGSVFEPKKWREQIDVGLYAVDILRNITCHDPTSRTNQTNSRKLHDKYPKAVPTLLKALKLAPENDGIISLKVGCLEIMESILRATSIEEEQEATLVDLIWGWIRGKDRVLIMTSLRIMVQLSLKEKTTYFRTIPPGVMTQIHNLIMLGDEELNIECLDFLYHATLYEENMIELTEGEFAAAHIAQLVRLLSFGQARIPPPVSTVVSVPTKHKRPVPVVTPDLPQDLLEDILKLPEPQRAVWWMRGCFEANPESEITQLALWQAYQRQFTVYINSGVRPQPLLNANDFIKNVATAFVSARPQMIAGDAGQPNRFVINGIVPREEPMGLDYNVYLRCDWLLPEAGPSTSADVMNATKLKACGRFFGNVKALFDHVRDKHTALTSPTMKDQACMWKHCTRFPAPGTSDRGAFYKHLMCHMPVKRKEPGIRTTNGASSTTNTAKPSSSLPPAKKAPDTVAASSAHSIPWTTEVPIKPSGTNELIGVAYMAAHVLKNLSKVATPLGASNMAMIRQDLFTKMAMNESLRQLLTDILANIYDARQNPADNVQMMAIDDDD